MKRDNALLWRSGTKDECIEVDCSWNNAGKERSSSTNNSESPRPEKRSDSFAKRVTVVSRGVMYGAGVILFEGAGTWKGVRSKLRTTRSIGKWFPKIDIEIQEEAIHEKKIITESFGDRSE
jgi:hypothetical protein